MAFEIIRMVQILSLQLMETASCGEDVLWPSKVAVGFSGRWKSSLLSVSNVDRHPERDIFTGLELLLDSNELLPLLRSLSHMMLLFEPLVL